VRLVTAVLPEQRDHVDALTEAGLHVRSVVLPKRTLAGEAARVAAAALKREPYVLYRRHDRPEIHAALGAEIAAERPDVMYLDHLDSFQFGGHAAGTPLVLDLHNIYSLLVRREAQEPSRNWGMRRLLSREAALLGHLETRAVRGTHAVFSVSEQEQAHYAAIGGAAVHLVPNGVDCSAYAALPVGRASSSPTVLFVGTLSWPPNVAAARFLAHDVLPALRQRVPGTALTIVGRDPGPDVQALDRVDGVVVAGNVPDIVPYLRQARVLAVPLEAGGGTRLKILEAFAAGLPVVTTPIGCEGIGGLDGSELRVAGRHELVEALCDVLTDPFGGEVQAQRALALVRRRYDWDAIAETPIKVIGALLDARANSRSTSRS
jgi:glycosyltransferase involved in cell wall biosynthesis